MSDTKKVQVSFKSESEKSFAVLVDVILDAKGHVSSASRLEWFPKSQCEIERIEPKDPKTELPQYFLTAPVWLLDKKKVKY